MKRVTYFADKNYKVGEVDPNLFGSFIEHLGRAVYTGIYEPDHPLADEDGFRKDVMELVKELNVPIVRYPGGNFLSGYDWTDGIGPIDKRPTRLDLAWRTTEPNEVGIDEFMKWANKSNIEPMLAVNLGTGTPKEAGNLVEYCNHPGNTYWSDLRIKNGHKDPHNVKVWCLGNEMDGPWQIGQLSAEDYGKKAREAAKIMKWVDPTIKLVACGSSSAEMPTFPEWDRVVLEHLYEHVDYISCHRYYENLGNVNDFLGSFADMDNFIKTIASTADYVQAKNRSKKKMYISFDEWNVWYQKKVELKDWEIAPPILEDNYSLLDALVFGGLMCTLLQHVDRVKMASLAQLVNVIAPIFTQKGGPAFKQTIFYPFFQVSNYGRGEVLNTLVDAPTMETNKHGEIPLVQSSTTYNPEDNTLSIFALNCSEDDDLLLDAQFRSFGSVKIIDHLVMDGPDLYATNNFDSPDNIKPKKYDISSEAGEQLEIKLPKMSWNMIRLQCETKL
ncbi:alpha-N-arabinofuranosidase [Metabacillus litoralis]|uniref:non-reducing end alpha-L-arabinofuranosidase n=1 Tax=Metabacillus litoralis TaxID=152268 RepID=A0A5C6VYC3_9BACI|nr:alpha-N-arabinofuranosidase [Metabacillus litoralis]TXC90551.1 alpha-N-arabinofuranosidase [Metabacillus litoralis]